MTPTAAAAAVEANGGSTGRLGLPSVERLLEPLVDRVQRRARGEDLGDADLGQLRDVGVGNDPAAEDDDLTQAALAQELDHPGEQRHVGAGEQRQADRVGVLLEDGLGDLLRRLVQAGVDDLEPAVAQRPGDDLGAPIVTVEAGFRDDDSVPALHAAGTIASLTARPLNRGSRDGGGTATSGSPLLTLRLGHPPGWTRPGPEGTLTPCPPPVRSKARTSSCSWVPASRSCSAG